MMARLHSVYLSAFAIVCFVIALFLFVTLLGFESRIRRLNGTLLILADFHKNYIEKQECGSWQDYQNEVDELRKHSTRLHKIELYLEYCNSIDSIQGVTAPFQTQDKPTQPAESEK